MCFGRRKKSSLNEASSDDPQGAPTGQASETQHIPAEEDRITLSPSEIQTVDTTRSEAGNDHIDHEPAHLASLSHDTVPTDAASTAKPTIRPVTTTPTKDTTSKQSLESTNAAVSPG